MGQGDALAAVHDRHLVEDDLAFGHRRVELRRHVAHEAQGDVGEDHAPAVGSVFGVSLADGDLVARVVALEQVGEEQAGRPAARDADLHSRSTMVTLAMPPPSHMVCRP